MDETPRSIWIVYVLLTLLLVGSAIVDVRSGHASGWLLIVLAVPLFAIGVWEGWRDRARHRRRHRRALHAVSPEAAKDAPLPPNV